MWKWPLAFLVLLHGIQYGLAHTGYYRRKLILGHFSLHILTITNRSNIQCASLCCLTDGCSVISFFKYKNVCELAAGTGVYIVDPDWTSLVLSTGKQPVDNQTGVSDVTSSATEISPMTSHSIESTLDSLTSAVTMTSFLETDDSIVRASTTASSSQDGFSVVPTKAGGTTCPSGFSMTISGYCFQLNTNLKNFKVALFSCETIGGYLAEISSKTENMELIDLIQQRQNELSRDVFIGGTDQVTEGTWVWLSGASFFGWLNGAPNNYADEADCLAYSYANAWQWSDVFCSDTNHFICEADPI